MPVPPPMAVPDLLRQRRIELGLPPASPPLRPAWVVLGMGAGIGTVVVVIVLIVYWQLLNRERSLQQTVARLTPCLLYTSPSPRDRQKSPMPSSA